MKCKMARHLKSIHAEEREVAQALSWKTNSKDRSAPWELIRKKGDFYHNTKVLQTGSGNLIVVRRSSKGNDTEADYGYVETGTRNNGREPKPDRAKTQQQTNHISQRMRQLARLVLQLRQDTGNEDSQLRDYINPERFDVVVGAVKEVSKFDQAGTTKVGVPSMALKLGHSLKKCAAIVRGIGLRSKCATTIENAGYFLELMKGTSSEEISTHALTTLGEGKFNQPEILPVTEDLLKSAVKRLAEVTGNLYTENIDTSTTHLVMKTVKDRVPDRTLKFFEAVANKLWVVAFAWVEASFKRGSLAEEEPFEVRGDTTLGPSHYGPKHAREAVEPLLQDYSISIIGHNPNISKEQVASLAKTEGAEIVKMPMESNRRKSVAVLLTDSTAPEKIDGNIFCW
ncbi:Breast cancer type 1 susceptibility protein-like [Holothuria leucospilota]|uniref:Breast cancer type 1 susceptibility protein-like n=1 Tax=Holothuria leucospilota TaxID=206669 RepID=A0A9Q1CQY5_HOLLE|nr:Breast cancer type 1 susceptibility protein-like [Holothuria leucospilota]